MNKYNIKNQKNQAFMNFFFIHTNIRQRYAKYFYWPNIF